MYGSRAVTLLVLISDDVINRILKLDIQTNILVYVTRCCTDLTSKVLKERTFGQSSALLNGPTLNSDLPLRFSSGSRRVLLNKSYSFVILLGPEPRPPLDPRMDSFPRNLAYLMNMRQRGRGFEPHRRHCVVSLSKTH